MDGSDIDSGFLRSSRDRKAVDHHATNLHQGTAQNLSQAMDFLASVEHGQDVSLEGPPKLRMATAAG